MVARIRLTCSVTMVNNKKWTVERVDPSTESVLETIDPMNTDTNTELFMRRRELSTKGLYRFTFTVTMDDNKLKQVFQESVTTYLDITDSLIRASMMLGGTSLINAGHGVSVTFEPIKYSRDMNLEKSDDQVQFNQILILLFLITTENH